MNSSKEEKEEKKQEEDAEVVKTFPPHTYAFMVHTLFADRVQEYLRMPPSSSSSSSSSSLSMEEQQEQDKVQVLDTQHLTGVSRSRRGYVLLLIPIPFHDKNSPVHERFAQLSPMARQNISWVSRITHRVTVTTLTKTTGQAALPDAAGTNGGTCNAHTTDTDTTTPLDHTDHGIVISQSTAQHLWNELFTHNNFDPATSNLRIDVYPRELTNRLAYLLEQQAAFATADGAMKEEAAAKEESVVVEAPTSPPPLSVGFETKTNEENGEAQTPFGTRSPILWTKSRSKCTHRLTVLFFSSSQHLQQVISSNDENEKTETILTNANEQSASSCYSYSYGLETRANDAWLLQLPLNHQAAQEIVIVPCHPQTGADVPSYAAKKKHRKNTDITDDNDKSNSGTTTTTIDNVIVVDPFVPLSRAYYKLHQVWKDHLESTLMERLRLRHGAGLDLGACPGGWTQVLVQMGLPQVVAVDPGKVGRRIANLPHVHHLPCRMQEIGASDFLNSCGPFSIIVCDASALWTDVMETLIQIVVTANKNDKNNKDKKFMWCLPCVWVVTLKFPHKTLGSVRRHVELVRERLPKYLRDLARALYPNQDVEDHDDRGLNTSNDHTNCNGQKKQEAGSNSNKEKIAIRHQVLHLMANSDSERTLLAVFEDEAQEENQQTHDKDEAPLEPSTSGGIPASDLPESDRPAKVQRTTSS